MNNTKHNTEANSGLSLVDELTPISLKEAVKVIGKTPQYKSDEAMASAILDFTAIARAFLRTIPKYHNL